MLYLHPALQILATCLAIYALLLGRRRWQTVYLGKKVAFKRKRHILVGKLALAGWLAGMVGGAAMVRILWGGFFITGPHFLMALVMLPLILFGLLSGYYMEKLPKPRRKLPLAHGLVNLLCILLALWQVKEGIAVLHDFNF